MEKKLNKKRVKKNKKPKNVLVILLNKIGRAHV